MKPWHITWLTLLAIGCNTDLTVHPVVDPAGGAISDREARIYEFDKHGPWYVAFVRADGMLLAIHRHDPGIQAFFLPNGDLLFYARSSGRGEVVDLMGHAFSLKNGAVFLCDVTAGDARVEQLPITPPHLKKLDSERLARTLYELSTQPPVAAFLSPEGRARLQADWQIALDRKRKQEERAKGK